MYTLLVGGLPPEELQEEFTLTGDRFLEYTGEAVAVQLRNLSNEARECLVAWPCLRMVEGRGAEAAFIAKVVAIQKGATDLTLSLELLQTDPPMINEIIWRERTALDIEQFEFSRHHWAIKDRDLLAVLRRAGHQLPADLSERFSNPPLPAPARQQLLHARNALASKGQTDIDDLLLEAGVPGLDVPRSVGSRRDRANAIIDYSLRNPGALTAENSLFSVYLVSRLTPSGAESPRTENTPSISNTLGTATPLAPVAQLDTDRDPNRVFIVHGHNQEARTRVVALLQRIGLQPVVLHEQPNMGRHLLTKFIDEAGLVTFAVVLMTDDDEGRARGGTLAPRARQNVVLELGYFLAHLRQARVCALITPGLETPSDFDGIVYIPMDGTDAWQHQLLRELRAAHLPLHD